MKYVAVSDWQATETAQAIRLPFGSDLTRNFLGREKIFQAAGAAWNRSRALRKAARLSQLAYSARISGTRGSTTSATSRTAFAERGPRGRSKALEPAPRTKDIPPVPSKATGRDAEVDAARLGRA